MKNGDRVVLRKIRPCENPAARSALWSEYTVGRMKPENVSIPIGYELEGILLADISVGRAMTVDRAVRNGVAREGLFLSSPVTRIFPEVIQTENSVYRIRIMAAQTMLLCVKTGTTGSDQ